MGDFTFLPAATAPAAAPPPEEPPAAAGPGPPRRRVVHFQDFAADAPLCWFPPSPPPAAAVEAMAREDDKTEKAAGELEEDRMDMLWEDFNEELALRRAGGLELSPSSSDTESSERPHGCAPVLRPSVRAGGAGHYRRRAGTWVLLMRIFRRLFVIDKTISTAARQHAAARAR